MARHAIPDSLWSSTLRTFPFLPDDPRLRQLCSLFLATKEFHGVGLPVTDDMAVAVAAQACWLVLNLPPQLALYEQARSIVLHQGEVRANRVTQDDSGLVHEWAEDLVGEVMEGDGPVMLAWSAVLQPHCPTDHGPAFNVVLHEFAHLIDMADGLVDGVPPLASAQARAAWSEQLTLAWDRFADRIAHGEASCIDPYGTAQLDEFFAVAVEAFFVWPQRLHREDPALYTQLADYFQQEPGG